MVPIFNFYLIYNFISIFDGYRTFLYTFNDPHQSLKHKDNRDLELSYLEVGAIIFK